MAERNSTGLLMMMLEPTPAVAMTLPAEVREKLAELELELSEGNLTTTCMRTTSPCGYSMLVIRCPTVRLEHCSFM